MVSCRLLIHWESSADYKLRIEREARYSRADIAAGVSRSLKASESILVHGRRKRG